MTEIEELTRKLIGWEKASRKAEDKIRVLRGDEPLTKRPYRVSIKGLHMDLVYRAESFEMTKSFLDGVLEHCTKSSFVDFRITVNSILEESK